MKRVFAFLMVALMIPSLVACGSDEDTVAQVNTEATTIETVAEKETESPTEVDPMLEIVEVAKYVEKELGDKLNYYYREVDTEILSVLYYADDIEIDLELDLKFDNISIEKGTPAKNLINAGYEMKTPEQLIRGEDEASMLKFENKENDTEITLNLYNSSTSDMPAKDCTVNGFLIADCIEFADYCGITVNSGINDVLDKFGAPSTIQVTKYSNDKPCFEMIYNGYDEDGDNATLTVTLTYENENANVTSISLL